MSHIKGGLARGYLFNAGGRRDYPLILETPAGGNLLPRKPNYKFERFERDRAKAVKKAARLQAKADRRTSKPGDADALDVGADEGTAVSVETGETETEQGTN